MVQKVGSDRAYRNLIVRKIRPCSGIHQLNTRKQVGKISRAFRRIRNRGNLAVVGGAEPRSLVAPEIKQAILNNRSANADPN